MSSRLARLVSRRALAALLVAAGLALVAIVALLPPDPLILRQPDWRPAGTVWRGAFHVHTNRSDGTGTIDEVAAAAGRAGLQFVILTDHGDGTRPPEPPRYRSGVLVIDGVEISTSSGHYAAVGMRQAPYPLGGEGRDVVEDVRRLGGFGVITHPDSPKGGQPWGDWDAPADAMEWLNADSEWRDEPVLRLARAAAVYPFRPAPSLALLLNRPALLARWDRAASSRPLVAVAGADAHARLALRRSTEPYEGRALVSVPSYESSFRTFSLHIVTPSPASGRAADDAARLVDALRAGHLHTVIDAWATPCAFEFTAKGGGLETSEGGELATREPVVLRVRSNAPLYAALVLRRDGVEIQRVDRQSLVYATDRPGRYRVEIWLGRRDARTPIPWVVSNAITVRRDDGPREGGEGEPAAEGPGREVDGPWHVEHDAGTSAQAGTGAPRGQASLRFRIGRGPASGQFAALVAPIRIDAATRALAFEARADKPMRVSVQFRAPSSGDRNGERWRRSVYLDPGVRAIHIPVGELRPADAAASAMLSRDRVNDVLFVVDTVNAAPGTAGQFWIARLRLVQ